MSPSARVAAVGIVTAIAVCGSVELGRMILPANAETTSLPAPKPAPSPAGAAIVNEGKIGKARAVANRHYGPGNPPTYIYNGPGGTINNAEASSNISITVPTDKFRELQKAAASPPAPSGH